MQNKKIVISTLFVLLSLFVLILSTGIPKGVYLSPDENSRDYLIHVLTDTGSLSEKKVDGEYYDLIKPRNAVSVNNTIVPKTSFGSLISRGLISIVVGFENYFFVFSLIQALLFSFFFYYLFKSKNKKKNQLLLLVLFFILVSPIRRYIIFPIPFVFALFYYFKRLLEDEKKRYAVLFSVCYFIIVLFRYEYIFLFSPVILFALWFSNKKGTLIFSLFLSFIITVVFLLSMNFTYYQDPLSFGYSFDAKSQDASYANTQQSIVSKVLSYLLPYGFQPSSFLDKGFRYIFVLFPFALLPLLFFLFLAPTKEKNMYQAFLASFLLFIIYYGSNPYFFNYDETTIDSSYTRYFFFLILFFIGGLAVSLSKLPPKLKFFSASILLILLLGASVQEYTNRNAKLEYYLDQKEKVLSETPENTIIFTDYWDKILWPERLVATPSYREISDQELYDLLVRMNTKDNMTILVNKDSKYFQRIDKMEKVELEKMKNIDFYKVVFPKENSK
ncbi:hypothetical protein H6501_05980 [Candidatus Woesearchaeota archaeon]|nr:hypothetical protein [Candidatus Woesearchaeota archaeon]USN44162.1 MAG: hypothetical protein H6500_07280 [Candidatus Woesearchaeota archaeon]